MRTLSSFASAILLSLCTANAANWPSWRGPHHDGTCDETGLPVEWSSTKNVIWKVELPDRGNSTPVIWGNQLFITQCTEATGRRELICFDKKTGKELWRSGITYKEQEPTHATNPHCSSSPVTDGERVIVSFASAGVYCYDMQGKELWHRDLGPQHHIWGNGASPVIMGDMCFLNHGPSADNTQLAAMDKKTGMLIWSNKEALRADAPKNGFVGSWSDPLPCLREGKPTLIMSWPSRVCAIVPATGKEIWTCSGLNPLVYTSPLLSDDIIVSMGGFSGMALAVRAQGTGDITASQRIWHHPKSPQRIASGAIHDGHIYVHNDPGTAQCIELKTGKEVWNERLKGEGSSGQNWSSVVIAEGRCYTVNQGGDAFVFAASPDFKLLASNPMGEKVIGSIAVSDGHLYIRGHKHLFCIGK